MQMITKVNEEQTSIAPRMSINLVQDATVFAQSPKHEAIGFPTNAHLACLVRSQVSCPKVSFHRSQSNCHRSSFWNWASLRREVKYDGSVICRSACSDVRHKPCGFVSDLAVFSPWPTLGRCGAASLQYLLVSPCSGFSVLRLAGMWWYKTIQLSCMTTLRQPFLQQTKLHLSFTVCTC